MSDSFNLTTEFRWDQTKGICSFEGHPSINVVGTGAVDGVKDAWAPPHMLAAAVESCFLLTLLSIAHKMRVGIEGYSSTADAVYGTDDGYHIELKRIVIRPKFQLENEEDRSRLKMLMEKAKEYCLVARSLKIKVEIEL